MDMKMMKMSAMNRIAGEDVTDKEPVTETEDVETEDTGSEDECCVKCACGSELTCTDCGKSPNKCDC
jgi:hypothetical protein